MNNNNQAAKVRSDGPVYWTVSSALRRAFTQPVGCYGQTLGVRTESTAPLRADEQIIQDAMTRRLIERHLPTDAINIIKALYDDKLYGRDAVDAIRDISTMIKTDWGQDIAVMFAFDCVAVWTKRRFPGYQPRAIKQWVQDEQGARKTKLYKQRRNIVDALDLRYGAIQSAVRSLLEDEGLL